jgi:outer membrane protein assembly factor BamB
MLNHDAHATRFNGDDHGITAQSAPRLHPVWSASPVDPIGTTAIIGPGAVYAIFRTRSDSPPNSVTALDPRTGRTLEVFGARQLGLTGDRIAPTGDIPYALAYADGTLIVGNTTETVALDPATGRRIWSVPGGAFSLVAAHGVVYTGKVCQNPCGTVASQAIDIASGRVLWTHPGNGGEPLLLTGGYLYQDQATDDTTTHVHVYRQSDGGLVTTLPTGAAPTTGDGLSIYTLRYVITGAIRGENCWIEIARRAPLGAVQWMRRGNGCILTSLALAFGTVYVVSQTISGGTVQAVTGRSGQVLWSTTLLSLNSTTPVATNGLLFTATGGSVVALNASTGRVVWRRLFPAGAGPGPRPLMVAGGTLYVLNGEKLIALRP